MNNKLNQTGSKRHSLQAVELSQRIQTIVQTVSKPPSPSLLGSDHIESGLRLIPVSSSPLEHIHHVLCQVVQFWQACTGLLR